MRMPLENRAAAWASFPAGRACRFAGNVTAISNTVLSNPALSKLPNAVLPRAVLGRAASEFGYIACLLCCVDDGVEVGAGRRGDGGGYSALDERGVNEDDVGTGMVVQHGTCREDRAAQVR